MPEPTVEEAKPAPCPTCASTDVRWQNPDDDRATCNACLTDYWDTTVTGD